MLKERKVKKLTRRKFFRGASLGVAAVGTVAVLPGIAKSVLSPQTEQPTISAPVKNPDLELAKTDFSGSLVAHIRNASTGEISLMSGTKEVLYHDPELVRRLIVAAHQ